MSPPMGGRSALRGLGGLVVGAALGAAIALRAYFISMELLEGLARDLAYQHRHVAPPDPRESHAAIPAEAAELVLALLAKDPEARPSDAAAVAARLQSILRARLGA